MNYPKSNHFANNTVSEPLEIKKLKYFLDPIEDVLNTHPGRKLPKDKKIVGVKVAKQEDINIILKKKGQFLYYSLGYHYYMVTE